MKHIVIALLVCGSLAVHAGEVPKENPSKETASMTVTTKLANGTMEDKLKALITVNFQEANLNDVAELLQRISGANFIVTANPGATITLNVKDMPMTNVIRYIAELTGMDYVVEDHAVVFRPKPNTAMAGTGAGSYRMETSVEAAKESHQYTVLIKIHHSPDGEKWDVLSAPSIAVLAGQEGKIEIKSEKSNDGVECTALVKELEGGLVEVSVACKVREAGRAPWQSELKTRVKLR